MMPFFQGLARGLVMWLIFVLGVLALSRIGVVPAVLCRG